MYKRSSSKLRMVVYRLGAVTLLLLATGCATQVKPEAVTAFGNAVTQVRQQAHIALSDANKLSRDQSVVSILESDKPGLSEDRLFLAVKPSDALAWDNAFVGLQTYVSALQSLLSPANSEDFGDAAVSFGKELSTGFPQMTLPPGVATAFTEIGEILIQFQQQRDAIAAMQKADPSIRAALTGMSKAIGQDPRAKPSTEIHDTGLMGTVYSNWASALARVAGQFAVATDPKGPNKRTDRNVRQTALSAWLDMLDRRDAQLDALAALRQSLFALAGAHSAAARGEKADVNGLIDMIGHQIDDTKRLFQRFTELKKEKTS